jgi:hypothetical protein
MKTYCSICGHPNAYTIKKPKFCNECGQSLGILKAKVSPAGQVPPEPIVVEESQNDIIAKKILTLKELDVEIESSPLRGMTLGEIIEASSEYPQNDDPIRPSPKGKRGSKKMTKKAQKEFLDNWQKEAGAMRKK